MEAELRGTTPANKVSDSGALWATACWVERSLGSHTAEKQRSTQDSQAACSAAMASNTARRAVTPTSGAQAHNNLNFRLLVVEHQPPTVQTQDPDLEGKPC